ncbi:hypothetical protein [Caulobacter sp. 17J80-11]|uniref:hypothetical protein n=1 Tax=Caulobacter sp. 17J80-11 TaxID=2763502 RepID=UPI001653BB27|nr:hypothetical protein [Caulobacter sp. 17J80-11]MBC6982373.1 hypothetical protein [Caulobacter sp. 17J80-11]
MYRWRPELGVEIARSYAGLGRAAEAAAWYRRVLEDTPQYPAALDGLGAAKRG